MSPFLDRAAFPDCPFVQVYEILPEMDSGVVWREAALLRRCVHPHIVPLLGVALTVRLNGHVCFSLRSGAMQQLAQMLRHLYAVQAIPAPATLNV